MKQGMKGGGTKPLQIQKYIFQGRNIHPNTISKAGEQSQRYLVSGFQYHDIIKIVCLAWLSRGRSKPVY